MADVNKPTTNLRIKIIPKKGRGVFSKVAVSKGANIISEYPQHWVISTPNIRNVCHACCSNGSSLLKCSKCKFARYCDKSCQRLGWNDHKIECGLLSTFQQSLPDDTIRLLSRIIVINQNASKGRLVANAIPKMFATCISDLCSHIDEMKEVDKLQLAEGSGLLRIFLGSLVEQWTISSLMELIAKVRCNAFTICTGELQPVGLGIYPMAAMFNHNCEANCVPTFDGLKISIRAVKDIDDDTELTISYVDLMSTADERAEQLISQYSFRCDCSKCFIVTDKNVHDDYDDAAALAWSNLNMLQAMKKDGKSSVNIHTRCQAILEDLQDNLLPNTDISLMKILDMAMDAAICCQLWNEALHYGLQSLQGYREYFPDIHPSLGLQMFRVGKLHLYLEHLSEAHLLLIQAERILEITHGRQHTLLRDLITQLHHCEEEMRHTRLVTLETKKEKKEMFICS